MAITCGIPHYQTNLYVRWQITHHCRNPAAFLLARRIFPPSRQSLIEIGQPDVHCGDEISSECRATQTIQSIFVTHHLFGIQLHLFGVFSSKIWSQYPIYPAQWIALGFAPRQEQIERPPRSLWGERSWTAFGSPRRETPHRADLWKGQKTTKKNKKRLWMWSVKSPSNDIRYTMCVDIYIYIYMYMYMSIYIYICVCVLYAFGLKHEHSAHGFDAERSRSPLGEWWLIFDILSI